MSHDSAFEFFRLWAIPLFIGLMLVIRMLLKLFLFPIRLLLWLSVPMLILWTFWNWERISSLLFR